MSISDVRALAPEITLGAHTDLTLTMTLCLPRRGRDGDGENRTGPYPHPRRQTASLWFPWRWSCLQE